MQVTRMDLADAGSPTKLAMEIFKAEPKLTYPVPIEELARQLDISDIQDLTSNGFIGSLITDRDRSDGVILVNKSMHEYRRRFTVGHELGHFLLRHHQPPSGTQFLCSREDLRQFGEKDQTKARKMEIEANQFSALILMPPHLWRAALSKMKDPCLSQVMLLSNDFKVSREAAARAYAQYHRENLTIVIARDGIIDRVYRNPKFPRLCVWNGDAVPKRSSYFVEKNDGERPSTVIEGPAAHWLESDYNVRLPTLYEQVLHQQNGFAMIMLWVESNESDEYDPDEDRTSKERYREQQRRLER